MNTTISKLLNYAHRLRKWVSALSIGHRVIELCLLFIILKHRHGLVTDCHHLPMVLIVPQSAPMVSVADVSVKLYFAIFQYSCCIEYKLKRGQTGFLKTNKKRVAIWKQMKAWTIEEKISDETECWMHWTKLLTSSPKVNTCYTCKFIK